MKNSLIADYMREVHDCDMTCCFFTRDGLFETTTGKGVYYVELLEILEFMYSKRPVSRFKKPELDEVTTYFHSKNYRQGAQDFYDFYESNGWKVGKNPMKKWQSAANRWIRTNKKQVI